MYRGTEQTHYGQEIHTQRLAQCWSECKAKATFSLRRAAVDRFNAGSPWKKRGLAMVPLKFPVGLGSVAMGQVGTHTARQRCVAAPSTPCCGTCCLVAAGCSHCAEPGWVELAPCRASGASATPTPGGRPWDPPSCLRLLVRSRVDSCVRHWMGSTKPRTVNHSQCQELVLPCTSLEWRCSVESLRPGALTPGAWLQSPARKHTASCGPTMSSCARYVCVSRTWGTEGKRPFLKPAVTATARLGAPGALCSPSRLCTGCRAGPRLPGRLCAAHARWDRNGAGCPHKDDPGKCANHRCCCVCAAHTFTRGKP